MHPADASHESCHMTLQGRFAPSPTGPLHLGSLLAALGSYLSVKSQRGEWLIRFDDLDTRRNVPGAIPAILETLHRHGLKPDRPPTFQSARLELYQAALGRLHSLHLTFACRCSRKDLAGHRIYPGSCRDLGFPFEKEAIRLKTPDRSLEFFDRIQGHQTCNTRQDIGDIILWRRDGVFSYHLACAVDDGAGTIGEVVRGADLLVETAAQLVIMELLGLRVPRYAHLPVIRDSRGEKLSKQTHAAPVDNTRPSANLASCLALLGIQLPAGAENWPVPALIEFGVSAFSLAHVPKQLPPGVTGSSSDGIK